MLSSPAVLRAAQELGRWALRRRDRFRVDGVSMTPTLADGEFVLVDPQVRPQVGDLVLAEHPRRVGLLMVKRLSERLADGRVVLLSDNPAGSDSRTWGPVDAGSVRGRVTLVLNRPLSPTASTSAGSAPADARRRLARWLRR